jgi:hypothetical protein
MALSVACQCGNTYDLKDEYAGQLVRCPKCQAVSRAERSAYTPTSQADPAFDRDVFLLRQKHLAIDEKYTVSDESGAAILFVHRPAHFARNSAAALIAVAAAMGVFGLVTGLGSPLEGSARVVLTLLGGLAGLATLVLVASVLSKKRHVTFYRDEEKRERLLEILQDAKLQLLVATYTVCDATGQPIARLRKNNLSNLFRKRWEIRTLADQPAFVVREDSVVRALLRRVFGPAYGLLRTNFAFHGPDGRGALGAFDRKMTVFDRYVLDLQRDRHRKLDRRVAIALGVMLDTGEGR